MAKQPCVSGASSDALDAAALGIPHSAMLDMVPGAETEKSCMSLKPFLSILQARQLAKDVAFQLCCICGEHTSKVCTVRLQASAGDSLAKGGPEIALLQGSPLT